MVKQPRTYISCASVRLLGTRPRRGGRQMTASCCPSVLQRCGRMQVGSQRQSTRLSFPTPTGSLLPGATKAISEPSTPGLHVHPVLKPCLSRIHLSSACIKAQAPLSMKQKDVFLLYHFNYDRRPVSIASQHLSAPPSKPSPVLCACALPPPNASGCL